MRTKNRILVFLFSFLIANWVYWYDLDKINVSEPNKIDFSITPTAELSDWELSWEIKVLKDLEIVSSDLDNEDLKKVILTLKNDLLSNKSYNLLSVYWVDWTIDFSLEDELSLVDINNEENILGIQGISRLLIVDPKTIEVYFNNEVDTTEFEFKLFRESVISSITNNSWKLAINLNDNMDKDSSYLIMMVTLKDNNGDDLSFAEEIYDFTTPVDLWEKEEIVVDTPKEDLPIPEDGIDEGLIEDEISLESAPEEKVSETVEVNNLADNGSITEDTTNWANSSNSWSLTISEVALNAASTPDTWADTTILLIITTLMSAFVFYRRKIAR